MKTAPPPPSLKSEKKASLFWNFMKDGIVPDSKPSPIWKLNFLKYSAPSHSNQAPLEDSGSKAKLFLNFLKDGFLTMPKANENHALPK